MEECGVTYTNTEELIQDVLHDQTIEDYNNRYTQIMIYNLPYMQLICLYHRDSVTKKIFLSFSSQQWRL